jgi:hypothetical protein
MKNQPIKETRKDHFFDLIKGSGQPLPGPRLFGNPKMPGSAGFGGKQIHARTFGGASGRRGGKSR